ncbi:MAG: hypothetical protein JXA97_04840 [Anaerolineales bacterium]|nr:hypothetical protein [Anaerolineales bacterium]
MDEDLKLEVIDRLGRGIAAEDVVLYVCTRMGWQWPRAEAFVEDIRFKDQTSILKHRFGLRFFLALAFIFSGFAVLAFVGFIFVSMIVNRTTGFHFWSSEFLRSIAEEAPLVLGVIPVGISMVVGGIMGILNLFSTDQ